MPYPMQQPRSQRRAFDGVGISDSTSFDAGVPLRDVQIAARHADPRTTTRYDRARNNLDRHASYVGYEIEAESNRDVRRDVARAIVDRGWGLLELRPMRMSLEEIFLQLTTEEQAEEAAHA